MAKPTKALILAAGLGNRISRVSRTTPKPLLSLDGSTDGPTFLDWHLECLRRAGVKEIYLVGNRKTFQSPLKSLTPEFSRAVHVEWILNPTEDLSTSGSGHSTQFAFHNHLGSGKTPILDGKSRVLLMDADILYDPRLLELLLSKPDAGKSKVLTCSRFQDTSEEVMVFGPEKEPVFLGKGLYKTPLVDGYPPLGEAAGILLWEPQDHTLLNSVTEWVIRYSVAKTRSEHEDLTQRMLLLKRAEAICFGEDLFFMECDTPEEYEVLTREAYPALKKKWDFWAPSGVR